ncbi:MAG: hypothetical protein QNJ22_12790 [Desulfosarcinaceae bacterium]|nr:hypothetical protein [Desulfosarcinaceae bacterium]
MIRFRPLVWPILLLVGFIAGCGTSYKAQPLPFKAPAAYGNTATVANTVIGGQAFVAEDAAEDAFGFNIRGAGMLPVQLVFDNQGQEELEIDTSQTFLEDQEGNLWPLLTQDMAHERATKYAQTKEIAKEGAYKGFLGAAAGTIIGAAVGIVSGGDVGEALGKGAAVGAAAGATLGGAQGFASGDARRKIVTDLRAKSLQNKAIQPETLAHGILFFPGEAQSASLLRLKLVNAASGASYQVRLAFHSDSQ